MEIQGDEQGPLEVEEEIHKDSPGSKMSRNTSLGAIPSKCKDSHVFNCAPFVVSSDVGEGSPKLDMHSHVLGANMPSVCQCKAIQ